MLRTELSMLVGSRICHDLISPIGAISNGLELLALTQGNDSPEMQLIVQSISSANARVRFLRIAYGKSGGGQNMSSAEVSDILQGVSKNGRHQIIWTIQDDHPREIISALFLAIQCLETGLPLGGDIFVKFERGAYCVYGESRKTNQSSDLWAHTQSKAETSDLSASKIHFSLLPFAVQRCERDLKISLTETKIQITF